MDTSASSASESRRNTFDRERSAAFTEKEGFSVVAPMSVIVPASTCGRNASAALVEAMDLVDEDDRALAFVLEPLLRRADDSRAAPRCCRAPPRTERTPTRARRDHTTERRLADARRTPEDHRRDAIFVDRVREELARREDVRLPTKSSTRVGLMRSASGTARSATHHGAQPLRRACSRSCSWIADEPRAHLAHARHHDEHDRR